MTNEANPGASKSGKSRRDFLATAAAAAGAAALFGGCAQEKASSSGRSVGFASRSVGRPRDDEPLRIGVIGTGGMGTGHIHALLDANQKGREKLKIVALSDCCELRWADALKRCQDIQGETPDTYRDYREMLRRGDLHGVLIATPEHWHAQNAIDAMEAGIDVYCEKPMTLGFDDAFALRAAVHSHPDRIIQVGTQQIMLPKWREAKKLIAEGAIGKPTMSQTSYCRNSKTGEWNYYAIDKRWDPKTNLDWDMWCGPLGAAAWDPVIYARWRRYKKYSTGIIGDLLVHVMTPMMFALDQGWPTRVVATSGHYIDKAMENPDQVNLTIEFEKGHTMVVAGSTCNEVGLEPMIRGHKANMYLGGRNLMIRPERIWVDEVEERRVELADIGNDQEALRLNWLKCIRTREKPDSDVELGCKCMVAVSLAARSIWEGAAFGFDPATFKARRL